MKKATQKHLEDVVGLERDLIDLINQKDINCGEVIFKALIMALVEFTIQAGLEYEILRDEVEIAFKTHPKKSKS